MVAFGVAFVIVACGGTTATIDGGTDSGGKKVPCWGDARTTQDRSCTTTADCAVIDHTADCCGSLVEEGVNINQVVAVHNAEASANAGCSICKCPPMPTVDEGGASGGAYLARCDVGLCTAHAQ
jgi:hypothetical protein